MDQLNGTPRSRPLLKFANRVYTSTPQSGTRRFGSPSATTSSRKLLDRDALPASSLSQSRIDAARNIFRASSLNTSTARFEPAVPSNTMRRVFAPAVTPDAKRVQRDNIKTPRGTMDKASSTDLFTMCIPSPPPELTGEALAKEVPQELDQHGSVFADQYLAHLCPKDFTDLQRRQFFCILDLRRLKYAANEIFNKKDWKLNVMNFAKEFEKSRSLIMLRYGLYEFKNVKPSEEVLRKWRIAHGLEADVGAVDTPTKKGDAPKSTKRKADEELHPQDTALSASSANRNKRRATEMEAAEETAAVPKNKRKVPVSDEADENQPSKVQRTATPSATKSLFEKIAGRSSTSEMPKPPIFGGQTHLTPNPFPPIAKSKPAVNGSLARSVLDKEKAAARAGSGNIFGYLSDASSAKNSGVEADGESSTESEEETEQQESVAASGGANTPNAGPAPSLFTAKQTGRSGLATGPSSTSSEARESTPGRSLFDRVTKGNDGQPVRVADEPAAPEEADDLPANKTWTPGTPLKFAPQSVQSSGAATSSSIFGQKASQSTTSIFGGLKSNKAEETPVAVPSSQASNGETDKSGGESDKENTSQPAAKPLFGATSTEAPAPVESKPENAPKMDSQKTSNGPAPSLFGSAAPKSNMFGAMSQPAATNGSTPSPSLFGGKPTESSASAIKEAPKTSLFGQKPTDASADAPKIASSLFGAATPTPATAATDASKSNIFGSSTATAAVPTSSLFGSSTAAPAAEAPKSSLFGAASTAPPATAAPAEAPKSSSIFGAAGTGAGTLFGSGPTQPAAQASGTPTFTFGAKAAEQKGSAGVDAKPAQAAFGSPMKQDGASPAKRAFGDAMQEDQPSPAKKAFGGAGSLFGNQNTPSSQPPATSSFTFGSAPPTTTPAPTPLFGANAQAPASINFNFGAGGGASGGSSLFGKTEGTAPSAPAPAPGGFQFGGNQPASGGFVFNASSTGAAPSIPAPAGMPAANGGGANPFAFHASGPQKTPQGRPIKKPNFGASRAAAQRASLAGSPALAPSPAPTPAPAQGPAAGGSLFGNQQGAPSFNFSAASPQPPPQGQQPAGNLFGNQQQQQQPGNLFGNLQPPQGGTSTTGTNSPFNFGGASSLATTPATGTPEPQTDPDAAGTSAPADGDTEAPQEQINLVEGGPGEENETVLHEVRAKVLKFTPPNEQDGDDSDSAKGKSPWSTKGVGPLRLLKHKSTGQVRVLLRKEPTGAVALNRTILPDMSYKPEEKYVKLTTSNDSGSGLETWMVQVKSKDLAKALADALESNKGANKS